MVEEKRNRWEITWLSDFVDRIERRKTGDRKALSFCSAHQATDANEFHGLNEVLLAAVFCLLKKQVVKKFFIGWLR
jgi:hypothetical protein